MNCVIQIQSLIQIIEYFEVVDTDPMRNKQRLTVHIYTSGAQQLDVELVTLLSSIFYYAW